MTRPTLTVKQLAKLARDAIKTMDCDYDQKAGLAAAYFCGAAAAADLMGREDISQSITTALVMVTEDGLAGLNALAEQP